MPRISRKEAMALGILPAKATGKPKRKFGEYRNPLEADFARKLVADQWTWWAYEPITIRLAEGLSYTPDFVACEAGCTAVYEIKGSWKAKGARDSRTRLKAAAEKMKKWTFYGVTRKNGVWVYERIGG